MAAAAALAAATPAAAAPPAAACPPAPQPATAGHEAASERDAHVLVVKTPAAAANPALKRIRFRLGGDVQVQAMPDGSLRAISGNALLATTAPAVMWDSRRNAAGTGRASTAAGPGDAARSGAVGTQLANGGLLLVPDPGLLQGADFPLFVDPSWSVAKRRWAYATNNGSSNTDYSVPGTAPGPAASTISSPIRGL